MSVKVSQEQLQRCKEIQAQYEQTIYTFGQLHLQKAIIEAELEEIKATFNQIELSRQQISEEVEKEHGYSGTIDLTTGEFMPVTKESR